MSFLAPWALLWLGAIPVFLWLWRLASTHRRLEVPSLIPFEHLLRRQARRRTRLVVNALFWLQLAALLGLALALTRPVVFRSRARTTLVILDTSASMGSRGRGGVAFERAKRAVLDAVARKSPGGQFFLMTTAPVSPVLSQLTGDSAALAHAVQALRPVDLGGNLASTVRLGRSLLGAEPDEMLVVTDEQPPAALPSSVRWVTVGEPTPNVAFVGLDAQGPLCSPSDERLVATVQNFADESVSVVVRVKQEGRVLAEHRSDLAPHARSAFPLVLPAGTEGGLELTLDAPHDGLAVDNRARVALHQRSAMPILVRMKDDALLRTVSEWLGACSALTWSAERPAGAGPALLVTDTEEAADLSAGARLLFQPPADAELIRSDWVVSADHPIGSYLAPVERVAARLNVPAGVGLSGVPVVSSLLHGLKVPVVVAEERGGRRIASLLFDPSASAHSTPAVLAFLNSLRWLMGTSSAADDNFFNPLESNTLARVSTWRADAAAATAPPAAGMPPSGAGRRPATGGVAQPLASYLIMALMVLLLVEWRLYAARRS